MEKTIRCVVCRTEFSKDETAQFTQCIKCNTTTPPELIEWDFELKTNWYDMRILTIWAYRYIDEVVADDDEKYNMRKTIAGIIGTIRIHRPKDAPALTLAEELDELRDIYPDFAVVNKQGDVIFEPKKKLVLN